MTAQTDDVQRDSKSPVQLDLKVKTAVTIYKGAMVVTDATGYALPGANTAGMFFQGISQEQKDNTSGASGALIVIVERSDRFPMTLASAAITDIGKDVYISDDTTLTLTVGNGIYVGKIVRLAGTNLVEVQPVYSKAAIAAAIANAAAATDVAITDSSGGVDPGDDIIALVTDIDLLTDSTSGAADDTINDVSTAVTGVDGSGSNAASKADVDTRLGVINNNFKDMVDQFITQKAANIAILAAIAQLAAKHEDGIADRLATLTTLNALLAALRTAGVLIT